MEIVVAGKKYSLEYLGVKDGEMVAIRRNKIGQPRLCKSIDGKIWEVVDCHENYGHPSIQIINKKKI